MIPTADTALFCEAFPCNPRPFRTALADHLDDGGLITDEKAKRILHTLTGIVRGQLFRIDLARNADMHHSHLACLPGRSTPEGVLVAMKREADGCGTDATRHQWWTSIASLIFFAYGETGTLDSFEEWGRLHTAWQSETANLKAA
jgi:hypothetical protein